MVPERAGVRNQTPAASYRSSHAPGGTATRSSRLLLHFILFSMECFCTVQFATLQYFALQLTAVPLVGRLVLNQSSSNRSLRQRRRHHIIFMHTWFLNENPTPGSRTFLARAADSLLLLDTVVLLPSPSLRRANIRTVKDQSFYNVVEASTTRTQ